MGFNKNNPQFNFLYNYLSFHHLNSQSLTDVVLLCSPAMAASSTPPPPFPQPRQSPTEDPKTDAIRQRLVRRGVYPTPKIIHAIRKKEAQKATRRAKKHPSESEAPSISGSQRNASEDEDNLYQTISSEYRAMMKPLETQKGVPWERLPSSVGLGKLGERCIDGGKLREENLEELKVMFEERNVRHFDWLLDDDVEGGGRDEVFESSNEDRRNRLGWYRRGGGGDQEKISWLVHRF